MANLERKDMQLNFGDTNVFSSASTYPCGYSSESTDGTVIELADTSFEGMSVCFKCNEAVTGTGTVTAAFKVLVSDDKSSWTEVATSPSIASAKLTEGASFNVAIPHGAPKGKYVKATVTTSGTTVTGGKVTAFVDTYAGV